MKKNRHISNLSRSILWLVGYVNHDELTPLPACDWLPPAFYGLAHPPVDHHECPAIHILAELSIVEHVCRRAVFGIYGRGNLGEDE
jgi:hypothetical protein